MGEVTSNLVVRFDLEASRDLVDAYRHAGAEVWNAGLRIGPLLAQAGDLLARPASRTTILDLGVLLGREARDVEWRVDFLEAFDGADAALAPLGSVPLVEGWRSVSADDLSHAQLAALLTHARTERELHDLVDWLMHDGGFALAGNDPFGTTRSIPEHLRDVFAAAVAVALSGGWEPSAGPLPPWLSAGLAPVESLPDRVLVDLAVDAFDQTDALDDPTTPNPFDLDVERGPFGPFASALVDRPEAGRLFIEQLLTEFDQTGDTRLDMHEDHTLRATQLADIVVAAGTHGEPEARERFVDRLVRTINADHDTNGPVFWATWAVHADLALEHGITTTEPTFDQHHLMPDFVRPTWEHHWHAHVSPFALRQTFEFVQAKKAEARLVGKALDPVGSLSDWVLDRFTPDTTERYNDPGGTYSTRPKDDFHGLRFHHSAADRGRHVLIHALHDSSDRGDIGQDEFAIIDHGLGAGGRPTYTINLPGVIDLSNPVPGWDPQHMSVRDMDMAALLSATSSRVEDNLYAQMVNSGLKRNGVPFQANLLLVGHSFGADTAADLAADPIFTADFHVTHIVAAGYDSGPQLAHIDPDVDVVVLQNEDDKAILLESTQRRSAMSVASVSINTFAHEVRTFDGGLGSDIGHHQDRYIAYLEEANDPELTRFFESLAATGYARSGTSVAIDVTLDQNLVH